MIGAKHRCCFGAINTRGRQLLRATRRLFDVLICHSACRCEAVGIHTRFPHHSDVYEVITSKAWMATLSTDHRSCRLTFFSKLQPMPKPWFRANDQPSDRPTPSWAVSTWHCPTAMVYQWQLRCLGSLSWYGAIGYGGAMIRRRRTRQVKASGSGARRQARTWLLFPPIKSSIERSIDVQQF